jgi:hypothetical protein
VTDYFVSVSGLSGSLLVAGFSSLVILSLSTSLEAPWGLKREHCEDEQRLEPRSHAARVAKNELLTNSSESVNARISFLLILSPENHNSH